MCHGLPDYEEGFIECVPENELDFFAHYLPHRPVVKSETKIRPVFDTSASEKGFPSLNQYFETGPHLIVLIPTTLLRFREHDIGVVADIRRAFLQIEVNQKERDFFSISLVFRRKNYCFSTQTRSVWPNMQSFFIGSCFRKSFFLIYYGP